MYVRVLFDDGQCSQYSKTSFRIWGMKAPWPLAGREESWALSIGRTARTDMVEEQTRPSVDRRVIGC